MCPLGATAIVSNPRPIGAPEFALFRSTAGENVFPPSSERENRMLPLYRSRWFCHATYISPPGPDATFGGFSFRTVASSALSLTRTAEENALPAAACSKYTSLLPF